MCEYCEKCVLGDIYIARGTSPCYFCANEIDTTGFQEKYVDYDGQWHTFRFLHSIRCEGCGNRLCNIQNPCGHSDREKVIADLFKVPVYDNV